MKNPGDNLCEKCYGEFKAAISDELRALNKKLDLEIEKNKNIDTEEPETEEEVFNQVKHSFTPFFKLLHVI
jgi:hypothetical protein